jgi:hypothetical protein
VGIKRSELPAHVVKLIEAVEAAGTAPKSVKPRRHGETMAKGRIANPTGMNKIETDYHEHLRGRLLNGEIVWFMFGAINLKMGHDLHYRIDEFVMLPDGELQAHEVKGPYEREDSKVKRRTAARMFPWPLYIVTRDGDGWNMELVKP